MSIGFSHKKKKKKNEFHFIKNSIDQNDINNLGKTLKI